MPDELPYVRGQILSSTEKDLLKISKAWRIIHEKIDDSGQEAIFNFTGLERKTLLGSNHDPLDDEITPGLFFEKLRTVALNHLGGDVTTHDIAIFNRMAAATLATHLVMVKPGDLVIGVSASYSHATIIRAAKLAGARFVDTRGLEGFAKALENDNMPSLVDLTRLAVTYEILPIDELKAIVNMARDRDIPVYMDDAGGARVGPAVFGQPKMLELGVDMGATGLDKYGTHGPRLGLMAGRKDLVAKVQAKGFELGLEARPMLFGAVLRSLEDYDPNYVLKLVETTKNVSRELSKIFPDKLVETPVTAQLLPEAILEIAMSRAGINNATIVPYEASAALAMILLRDFGIITVHFAGLPPGTGALLIKFLNPETVARFGGPGKFAHAIDFAMNKLAEVIGDPTAIERLLLRD